MTKCSMCGGSGLVATTAEINCPACLGTGKAFGQRCSSCGGSGSENVAIEVLCPACHGTGDDLPPKRDPSGTESHTT
jgi:DnaJ-class molecular chaperone